MKGCDELLGLQDTLKALADPIRREILNLLKGGRLSAGEICEHFSVTGASISRHLAILKDADLIRSKREGKFIYYELNTSVLEDVMLWIPDHLFCDHSHFEINFLCMRYCQSAHNPLYNHSIPVPQQ